LQSHGPHWLTIEKEWLRTVKAVSYTHLDVYKRQMLNSAVSGNF